MTHPADPQSSSALPDRPADVLTSAGQLALPPGCRCSYALSQRDGRWHLITQQHCDMHGREFAAGERVLWIAPRREVVIDAAHWEHYVTLNMPDRWHYDIADPDTGRVLLYGARASDLARLT